MSDLPTMERYLAALHIMKHSLPLKHKKLLVKHYRAPEHTITATVLAAAVGYADYGAVNLQYGLLGQKLAARMKWEKPPEAQESCSIAEFIEANDQHPHVRWVMHPQLAAALETIGWVTPATSP